MNGTTRFNRETTADEVVANIDLTGKRFLVTGASSGLGQETARVLASRGAAVILAVRSPAKGQAAADAIRENTPDAVLDVQQVDLASLASIRAFAERIRSSCDGLDGIVANAGVMAINSARTSDGFEMQFGANHLGPLRPRQPARAASEGTGAVATGRAEFRRASASRRRPRGSEFSAQAVRSLGRLRSVEIGQRAVRPGIRSPPPGPWRSCLHGRAGYHHRYQPASSSDPGRLCAAAPSAARGRQPAAQAPGGGGGDHRVGTRSSRPGGARRSAFWKTAASPK